MADAAITKVEAAIVAALSAYAPLSDWTVIADRPEDEATESGEPDAIRVFMGPHRFQLSDEQNQTHHFATVEIEPVAAAQTGRTISAANSEAIAHVIAALAADRTLGGRLHDLQEVDVAQSDGKDIGAQNIQFTAEFFTPRDDWFTILGHAGATF